MTDVYSMTRIAPQRSRTWRQIENFKKHKKTPDLGRLLFCKSKMVHERVEFWNPFLESVLKVDAKLTKLGYIYLDGEDSIVVVDEAFQ
jgi:hypothetical protein